jgi:hypothetical protein
MGGTTVNELFDRVIRTTTARLQPLGFSQRGLVLRVMGQDTCGIVQFQRSTKSSKDRILFTINLGVVCGELLVNGCEGLRRARVSDAHVRQRIGSFLPRRPDRWWEITRSTDPDALALEISGLLVEEAVPFIQGLLSPGSIISLWESGQSPGITDGERDDLLGVLKANMRGDAK